MVKFIGIFIILVAFSGCGDIYEDPDAAVISTTTTTVVNTASKFSVRQGIFIDAAVAGIGYETTSSDIRRYTDSDGIFYYNTGDSISLYLGDAALGNNVDATYRISPLTLFSTADISDTEPSNMARLLQTLDSDSNVSNGIEINTSIRTAAAGKSVVFSTPPDDFGTALDLSDTQSILSGLSLITGEAAQNHVTSSLSVSFTPADIASKTFTIAWDLGSQYSVYKFSSSGLGTVEIEEGKRFIQNEANITSYSWQVTDGVLEIYNGSLTVETFTLLATSSTASYLVENSSKGLVSMTSNSQQFIYSDLNGQTFPLLTADGNYALFTFAAAGNTVYGTYAEDANATVTGSVTSGVLTVTGTVAGTIRTDTITSKVTHGDIYKVNHDYNSTLTTKATLATSSVPFFDAMAKNTYHCVTNKGLYYKLVLNNYPNGTISYQKSDVAGNEILKGTDSITWATDTSNDTLVLSGVRSPSGDSTTGTITMSLRSFNSSIYLVTHTSGFDTSSPEHVLMYKIQENKTVSEVTGTYDIFWDDYNSSTGELSTSRKTEGYTITFDSNKTGYTTNVNGQPGYDFLWYIDPSSGAIMRTFDVGLASSVMTMMYDYRGRIRTTDNYDTGTSSIQRFMTLVKQ
jgi:hypothetical protein